MYKKVCVICGKSFETRYVITKTCSEKCSYERRKKRGKERYAKGPDELIKTCIICGATFLPVSNNTKTCSPKCRKINNDNTYQRYLKKRKGNWDKKKNEVVEEVVEKPVEVRPPDVVCSYRQLKPGDPEFEEVAKQVTPLNRIRNPREVFIPRFH